MQNVLESAKHSAILQVLESKSTDTMAYSVAKSIQFPGELATQKFVVNCNALAAGMLTGGSFVVNLPQYGLLRKAFLRFRVTAGGNAVNLSGLPGAFAFQRIVLQTASGNAISTLYPDMIVYKAGQRPDASKLNVAMGAPAGTGLITLATTVANTYYCPLLFDAFDHPSTWLDCLSLEQLSLAFYGRSQSEWLVSGATALSSVDLVLYYALPSPERHNLMLDAKHPSGQSYNYIGFNQFIESTVFDTQSKYTIQMYCGSPIYRTIINIKDDGDITAKKLAKLVSPMNLLVPVLSIKVSDSGSTLYASTGQECVLESGSNETSSIVINWGLMNELDPDQKRSCSAISLFQMSNPIIELTFAGAAAKRQITIIHQTLNAVSVSASPNNRTRQITVLSDR